MEVIRLECEGPDKDAHYVIERPVHSDSGEGRASEGSVVTGKSTITLTAIITGNNKHGTNEY